MGYRLVALDIDGTIRSNEYPISERTRRAIDGVREAGAEVTLATGRIFSSALQSSIDLEIRAPIASFQGAHIADPVTGEVLWHRPLTAEMALDALNALDEWKMQVVAYLGHEVYVDHHTPWSLGYGQRNSVKVNLVDDLRQVAGDEPTRLVVVGEDDGIERLESSLKEQFDSQLHITRSLSRFCEILHPDGGKDKALEWLCGYFGLDQSETVAFGNGYNDVHMLQWAGLGVAIAGAVPEVLDVADRVAPSIEDDGAAHVLEELLADGLIG